MSFNAANCNVLRITWETLEYKRKYTSQRPIFFIPTGSYESLSEISSDKYLGVRIDNKL